MAFAIWLGSGAFELATQVIRPTIPLPDGNRIVAIRNWDARREPTGAAHRPRLRHLATDAEISDRLGAYRALERNLNIGNGRGEPVEVAEITSSAFRMTRVPPLMGRTLLDSDERADASPVVVIGYDAWQRHFGGDSTVIGRTVRLAGSPVTVVGVMPKSFAFPVAQSFWVPLRLDVAGYGRREGPAIQAFARLAPGVSLDEARAELTATGRRASIDFRDTHEHLRPQIMPYAKSVVNVTGWRAVGVISFNLPLLMLVALVCGNVALLMFARAATRESEIVVRTALGAGRGRIIMQLFAEALVLGGVAAVVGLVASGAGLRWVMRVVEAEFLQGGRLPFWFQDRLSPMTLLYAALLTVVAAAIAGVVPALKVTRGVGARLKQATAGAGGLRFGGVWTVVIVAQVAITVAFPATAFFVRRDATELEQVDVGFPVREFLSVRLEMDREPHPAFAWTHRSPHSAHAFARPIRSWRVAWPASRKSRRSRSRTGCRSCTTHIASSKSMRAQSRHAIPAGLTGIASARRPSIAISSTRSRHPSFWAEGFGRATARWISGRRGRRTRAPAW
jgi:hypothetical protein